MTQPPQADHVPDLVLLGAYLDDELDPGAKQQTDRHLAACARCAAQFDELRALSAGFKALPDEKPDFDLAEIVQRRTAPPRGWAAWGFAGWPLRLGAALSMAAGLFLGSHLQGSPPATGPVLAAMRVFAALPPGNLCAGLDSCYVKATTP